MKQLVATVLFLVLFVPAFPQNQVPMRTSGTLLVPPTGVVDLDAGKFVTDGSLAGVDVWYNAARPGVFELRSIPNRNSKLVSVGTQAPEFETCKNAAFSEKPINTQELKEGSYLCVRTDEGRIARVRIEGFSNQRASDKNYPEMVISFTTWEK